MFQFTKNMAATLAMVLFSAAGISQAATHATNKIPEGPLSLHMSNNPSQNELFVLSPQGAIVTVLPTLGKGGAAGNGGSVQVSGNLIAAADFGTSDVALFLRSKGNIRHKGNLATAAPPVSLAFGASHLYVLETTKMESFRILRDNSGEYIGAYPDGLASLVKADGSAGQIGYLSDGHLIATEKSGAIEEVSLDQSGAISGTATMVSGLPTLDTPLGLATQGSTAVVTSAHDTVNQQLLIIGGKLAAAANGTGKFSNDADCWNAFYGAFVYSADSPGKKIDRFVATDAGHLLFDKVTATLPGAPTDLAFSAGGMLSVIWSTSVSVYQTDASGELRLLGTSVTGPLNGAAWVE